MKTAGSILLDAYDNFNDITIGGGIGIGVSKFGFGAAVGNVNVNQTVLAYVGNNAVLVAKGNGSAVGNHDDSVRGSGLVISSAGDEFIWTLGAAGAGSEKVAIAGSVAVDTVDNMIEAYLAQGATVNKGVTDLAAGEVVDVVANHTTHVVNVGGSLAVALGIGSTGGGTSAAVGIGVSVVTENESVLAYADNADITASSDVLLSAAELATIWMLAIGGTIAASSGGGTGGSGGTGIGFAGAGTGVTLDDDVESQIKNNSKVSSKNGNVSVKSNDKSGVTANGGGVGISVGVSSTGSGTGVSLGTAIAINTITNHSKAFIDDSTVTAGGGVTVAAVETATITALTIGGSVAVGASTGGGNATGVALAGAGSGNTVRDDTEAYVSAGSQVTADTGAVTITSTDTSTVVANGGGVGIAVGGSASGNGVGVTVGISAAMNDVENQVLAYVDGSTVNAPAGGITLSATETATIMALTIGGALAAGGSGGGNGVGVGGAGAGSGNTIKDHVLAYVQNGSTLTAGAGDVTLAATDRAAITADGGGVSLALGASGGNGVGVSLGVAVAINDVEDQVKAYIDGSSVTAAGSLAALGEHGRWHRFLIASPAPHRRCSGLSCRGHR